MSVNNKGEPIMSNAEAPSAPDILPTTALSPTSIRVANTQSLSIQSADDLVVHPVPALDGFGLFVTAILVAAAAFWIWRRQR